MNSESFVTAIRQYVQDAAVFDTIKNTGSPPGRRVSDDAQILSDWYQSLGEVEKKHIETVARMAAHAATFGLLAVLDGARTITSEKGEFELQFHGAETVRINQPTLDLHSLL